MISKYFNGRFTVVSLLLVLILSVSLVGCDGDEDTPEVQQTAAPATTAQPASDIMETPLVDILPPEFGGLVSVSMENEIYVLSWEAAADDTTDQTAIVYDVFESEKPGVANYDFTTPFISQTGATSIDVSGLNDLSRHFFIVRARDENGNADRNTIEQTQRDLQLTGAPNFRDLGGYINSEGIQVAWGQIFRSGDLVDLDDADLVPLSNIGLNTVLDIREQDDIERDGHDVLYEGNEAIYEFLHFCSGDPALTENLPDHPLAKLAADVRLVDLPNWYINILEENKEGIKTAFEFYADPSNYPILVHCTQGKDRAGVVSALLLSLLDVPRSTVVQDFLLTCELTVEDIEAKMTGLEGILPTLDIVPEGVTAEDWRPVLGCPQDAMENLLDHLETKYNGVESFLESIGVTPDQQQTIKKTLLKKHSSPS